VLKDFSQTLVQDLLMQVVQILLAMHAFRKCFLMLDVVNQEPHILLILENHGGIVVHKELHLSVVVKQGLLLHGQIAEQVM
jgi:hypothetical protein